VAEAFLVNEENKRYKMKLIERVADDTPFGCFLGFLLFFIASGFLYAVVTEGIGLYTQRGHIYKMLFPAAYWQRQVVLKQSSLDATIATLSDLKDQFEQDGHVELESLVGVFEWNCLDDSACVKQWSSIYLNDKLNKTTKEEKLLPIALSLIERTLQKKMKNLSKAKREALKYQ
jgi:hypothetical protein